MVDFRKWLVASAILALGVSAANAQIGGANPGGSANQPLVCTALAGAIPTLRPEGYTELLGDIVITCTGGPLSLVGSQVPTTNITVSLIPNVPVTSRLFSTSNGASEALLLIDEPGSTVTAPVPGYGPAAPQTGCSVSQQQAFPSPCTPTVGVVGGYQVTQVGGVAAPNVFEGQVGGFGNNNNAWTVNFYNVPVLPPGTSGISRVFRITNVRMPAVGQTGSISAFISTSPSTVLPLSSSTVVIGVVGQYMTAGVKTSSTSFYQCTAQGTSTTVSLAATLAYTEGFATGFKTRVVPGGAANSNPANMTNIAYAGQMTNTIPPNNQNIPGGLYGGFASNSESGFISPLFGGSTTIGSSSVPYTAGLADYGTRLKAVFYNLPSGVSLYVSTNSINTNPAPPSVVGGTSTNSYAVLVGGAASAEASPDGFNSSGGFSNQIAGSTNSKGTAIVGGTQAVYQLTAQSNGTYEAVWEVTNSNPSAIDNLQFGVYISYTPTAGNPSLAPPLSYGLPTPTTVPGALSPMVWESFAPDVNGGAFSTANSTQGQFPIPRFANANTSLLKWLTISQCQTTLIYPYVVSAYGFDTGLAVANTSTDPSTGSSNGTLPENGSCTLYAYGVAVPASGTPTASAPIVLGCDSPSLAPGTGLPGSNCFPVVNSGTVQTFDAYNSTLLTGFSGYVIAVCNFLYAHGYAAVTDLGVRNIFSSYLALELVPQQTITCSGGTGGATGGPPVTCALSGGVGSPRSIANGVEQLVH